MTFTRQQQRSTVRGRRKLFGGQMTSEEVHQKYAFPPHAKCNNCGRRPLTRVITMMELAEAKKISAVAAMMELGPEAFLQHVVAIKDSAGLPVPYFRTGVAYACKSCTPLLERVAAKAPSHCIVEINRGPGSDNPIVGLS